jgi:REP element-mobilizing transposase RayT
MTGYLHTTRFTRRKLPHWEVEHPRFFVTVRCARSLPASALGRLKDIHNEVRVISPRSEKHAQLQRSYFLTIEKYLDVAAASFPLANPSAANELVDEFQRLSEWNIKVSHYSILPNHWHAMIVPDSNCRHTLSEIMRRLKGRSARRINLVLGRAGSVWQSEWFDRWMRSDTEHDKCVRYIQENPVKAGITKSIGEHTWTR